MISDADILKTRQTWLRLDKSRQAVADALGLTIGAVQRRLEAFRDRDLDQEDVRAQVYDNPTGAPKTDALPRRHIFIPDTQIRPGVPTDHIEWIAKAVVHYRPDVIVVGGDWWDFPSLNSHSKPGSAPLENQRYQSDLDAGNAAFAKFCNHINKAQGKDPAWKPRKVFLCGNHEDRADRAAEADPKFLGHVGSNNCQVHDFEWHPFLKIVWIDGIAYAHYFQNSHSKFAIGGSIDNRLNKIGASFVQGHEQGKREGARIMASGRTLYGLVAGSCLTPDHKVLTSDLSYIPLGDVQAGQQLVSFDEEVGAEGKRSRRYVTGTVEAVKRDFADCFEVTLGTGKVFKVTGDHLWLVRKQGTTTGWMRTDQFILNNGSTHVPVLLDEWEPGRDYEHGWLAGMFDGEGCLYARQTTGGACIQLSLSQKPGAVLDYAKAALSKYIGVESYTEAGSGSAHSLRITGGRVNTAKVLGVLRPIRLLRKFAPKLLGRMSINRWTPVVSVRAIGRQEIVRIAVDAKTMVVEGYGHHNCYLHQEEYRGRQGQRHWRGIYVFNEVQGGEYDGMPLSLNYLCRKNTGKSLVTYMRETYSDADWEHLI